MMNAVLQCAPVEVRPAMRSYFLEHCANNVASGACGSGVERANFEAVVAVPHCRSACATGPFLNIRLMTSARSTGTEERRTPSRTSLSRMYVAAHAPEWWSTALTKSTAIRRRPKETSGPAAVRPSLSSLKRRCVPLPSARCDAE